MDSSYALLVVNMERGRFVHFDRAIDIYRRGINFHNSELMKEITMLKEEFNNVFHMRIPDWNTQLMEWPADGISCTARR